jgi:alpha-tubulin suppressor-like RCC1 family protein
MSGLAGACSSEEAAVGQDAAVDLTPPDTSEIADFGQPDPGTSDLDPLDPGTGEPDPGVDTGCTSHAQCPISADPCLEPRCQAEGTCGFVDLCACRETADCAAGEDGNPCNGTPVCDKSAFPWRCVLTPPLQCPAAASPCLASACDPADGKCGDKPVPDGTACLDSDPCTVESTCISGVCTGSAASWCECKKTADCAEFEDGNACNGTLFCNLKVFPHKCEVLAASVVSCAGQPATCHAIACDPASGKCESKPVADGTSCDDGNPCTAGDTCQGGTCSPTANTCICKSNADCAKSEDGDLCNGTLYCDKAADPPICKLNPATLITCPTVKDTACEKNVCIPTSGICVLSPVANGAGCDDGDKCTDGDICVGGACVAGKSTCPCKSDAECADKDDGDKCNGLSWCNLATGFCKPNNPATAVSCPSVGNDDCAKNVCLPAEGTCTVMAREDVWEDCAGGQSACTWRLKPPGALKGGPYLCEDSDLCTATGTCLGKVCKPGTNLCLCKTDADCAGKDDGNLCNGLPFCDLTKDPATCGTNPATVVTCPSVDDTACIKNTCEPKTGLCGLGALPTGAKCDDGEACTTGDFCVQGKCAPGKFVCACASDADCLATDDGNLCNGVPYCDKDGAKPECKPNPSSVVWCAKVDDSACLKNQCQPKTGKCSLQPAPDGTPCVDGSLCSAAAACKTAECAVTKLKDCDDGSLCTKDACDPLKGCQYSPVGCADGNECTADVCNPKDGQCTFAAAAMEGKACSGDDNGCTVNDTCASGVCVTGFPVACKVEVGPCEEPTCVSLGAKSFDCVAKPKPDGVACAGDASACLIGSSCQKGKCAPGQKERLFLRSFGAAGEDLRLHAAADLADGGSAVAGVRTVGGAAAWWIQRLDAAGEVAWKAPLGVDSAQTGPWVRPVGLIETSKANLVVAGSVRSAGGDHDVRILEATKSGDGKAWDRTHGSAGVDEALRTLVAHPSGGYVVAGWREEKAARDGLIYRLSSTGLINWTWSPAAPMVGAEEVAALAVATDGGLFAAGYTESQAEGKRHGWLLRTDAGGATKWSKALGTETKQELTAAARTTGGGLALAGWRSGEAGSEAWLLEVDSAGATVWERVMPGSWRPAALILQNSGAWVLAGAAGVGGANPDLWLAGLDSTGHPIWEQGFDGGEEDALAWVSPSAEGGLVAAGWSLGGGQARGLLVRADAWGHASCANAGVCLKKTAADCTDSNVCTDDLCDAADGCLASPNAEPCTDGDACTEPDGCKAKACKPGKPLACDDANSCTQDACDKSKGCTHQALDSVPCPDDSVCTAKETCVAGTCKSEALACADANPCTSDICDALAGCQNKTLPDETPCGSGQVCVSGKCLKRWALQVATEFSHDFWCVAYWGASCALRPGGEVWCWGRAPYGKVPKPVGNLTDAVWVGGGMGHFCARTAGKIVKCWGSTSDGALGNGVCSHEGQETAQPAAWLEDVAAVGVGSVGGLAVKAKGEVFGWGNDNLCNLGLGGPAGCRATPVKLSPTEVKGADQGGFLDEVASVVLKQDGTVLGSGYFGPGDGNPSSKTFVAVGGLTGIVAVEAGVNHRVALDKDGAIWGWGRNAYGQTGNGAKGDLLKPAKAFGQPGKAKAIAAGFEFSCALYEDATVWCWGRNHLGQLGNGSNYDSVSPVKVKDLADVQQVDTEGSHACAVRKDGSVWCWGMNQYGQLGDGTTAARNVPVAVVGSVPQ